MLKKGDLKVIRGGALASAGPDEKFVDAYATDTRLMGVLVIYIRWQLSGIAAARRRSRDLRQFFYIETTEEGIESYQGLYGDDEEELRFVEQSMVGGLGAGRVLLSMNEAVFLVQRYAEMTRRFGKQLPSEREEFEFILRREISLSKEREKALFSRLCGEIKTVNQLINCFLMRCFGKDYYAAAMLAADIAHGDRATRGKGPIGFESDLIGIRGFLGNAEGDPPIGFESDPIGISGFLEDEEGDPLKGVGIATLCRNEISAPEGEARQGEGSYVCESVIEEDQGHRIVVSEIRVLNEDGKPRIASFDVLSMLSISPVEAAMKLSRPEYVTVYEVAGSVDRLLFELDGYYTGAMQKLTEGGKLYLIFNDDNRHLAKKVYLLNDDVKEILYVTVEDQLIIGSYTLSGIKKLENRLVLSRLGGQLIEVAKYEFKEPILYDYTMSYGGDFVRYIDEIMGFEDDGE